ncbi:snRNA-activating protein complex subunit isoform X1 [Cinnamomum micranthum f. kanehirae]|uniref:snRNA-activating protein complex subunit isoform X1 n=1 Tax=Cinnamomum micranthum f. kanehirae TaxID=337451 RepID=A0A3S3NZL0_9MAGN|nr:snRNA-activating protein complex subunit isoform X1 [Cinnamomum micranthum f. kanehirae]
MEMVEYQPLEEEKDHRPSCTRELVMDSTMEFDNELSFDELKVLSEEELVDKAFKEAFKDTELTESSSQVPEDSSNEMRGQMILECQTLKLLV